MLKQIITMACAASLLLPPATRAFELNPDLLNGVAQTLATQASRQDNSAAETEELAVGRQIAGNLLGAAALVKDKGLQKYVNQVGRWVANQSERPELAWHFGVIDSPDINAFATPGGYIFVTCGLYKLLKSEAELAGVLAHEIGHVVRKHHYRVIQQAKMIDFGSKLLTEKVGSGNQLTQQLIGSGAEIVARGLDKSAEYEADRMGVVLAARAGYDQYGLVEVLQQMGHYSGEDDSIKLLFKTHPHPDERLTRLDESMGDTLDDLHGETLTDRLYKLKK